MDFVDYKGQKFNRWTVIEFIKTGFWKCICDCGTERIKCISALKSGGSKSCGCLRREVTRQRNLTDNPGITTHGMTGTPEFSAFKDARRRCNQPHYKRYKDYGGRGIKFLFKNFEEFFAESGRRPGPGYSIDRIDNNGNYEVGNIKWSTTSEQAANRRQTFIDLTGERFGRLTVLSVAERMGKRGYSIKWLCLCDCGEKTIVAAGRLGRFTNSCGCLRRETTSKMAKERKWLS
jgi:hypothetical protein